MPARGRSDGGWRSRSPVSTRIANATRCNGSNRSPSLMQMRRGDLVTVAASGDYGKPRPAVIVQTDAFPENHASVVVCQLTSELADAPDFRVTIEPKPENGLRFKSQVMADKPVTMRRERIVQNPAVARHGRSRWALLRRYPTLMRRSIPRRDCQTPARPAPNPRQWRRTRVSYIARRPHPEREALNTSLCIAHICAILHNDWERIRKKNQEVGSPTGCARLFRSRSWQRQSWTPLLR